MYLAAFTHKKKMYLAAACRCHENRVGVASNTIVIRYRLETSAALPRVWPGYVRPVRVARLCESISAEQLLPIDRKDYIHIDVSI